MPHLLMSLMADIKYNIYVMVSEDSKKAEKADWLLEDTIPAGEYRAVDPNALPSAE